MFWYSIPAALAVAVIAGCSNPQASNASRLEAVSEELRAVKEELADLKEQQTQDNVNRIVENLDRFAYLQPGDEGYSTIRYDLGSLTVQLADVAQYANGSKVTLKIGNPLYSAISGLKLKIEWGRTDDKGTPVVETTKSKGVTLGETLRPGAWNQVPIVLDGVPPSDLGFVRLRDVTHTGITLNR